jgi:GT2 family glycosyltransferase
MTAYAAIVVLHESDAHLALLLSSLERLPPQQRPRLIVVDSGPDDGGAQRAADHGAHVILRRDNPGFGAANNAALERIDEDVTVLLNPDTQLLDGSLATLARHARAHPRQLHAPRLLNPDGSVQRSAHPLPGTLGGLLGALMHPPLLPYALRIRAEPFRAHAPRTIGWATAACLAASTQTLRDLGPFDPRIHLFGEDLDLCLRARAQGIRTVYHPQLAVRHHGGHSAYRREEPFAQLARTRREAIERDLGRRAQITDDLAQALTFAIRAAGKRPNDRERAQLRALHEAVKQRDPGTGPGSR